MTVTLATALLLQAATIALLRWRLGKVWLRRPVVLLVLASVVYDGVSPVLMTVPSIGQWDNFRQGVQPQYADQAALIMAGGMLALACCYVLARPEHAIAAAAPGDIRQAARVLDWRLLALACLPLAVLTYSGRGYNGGTLGNGDGAPLSTELASVFFVLLTVLAAFSFLLRRGSRWFLPVLAVQSVALAAAGERTPVLVDAIALVVLLAWSGRRPSARQLAGAAALTVAGVLAITGVRAEQGRTLYDQDSGVSVRVTALASGITSAGGTSATGGAGLVAQAAARLDGTDFAAAILQARAMGVPRLDPADVPESLLIAVPSALWPSKLGHALNPVGTEQHWFALQDINFLPGLAGMYTGFLPAWQIAVLLAAVGWLSGIGERRLLREATPARLVLLAGSLSAALNYEEGLPGIVLDLRAAVVIAVAVKAAGALLDRQPAGRASAASR